VPPAVDLAGVTPIALDITDPASVAAAAQAASGVAILVNKQAMENMEYVRWLLGQKQPGFAASLELAVSLTETSRRNRWTVN
jgi:hypothetical protein